MIPTWRPSEIIINNTVIDDPITQHFISKCPGVPVKYVTDSKASTIKAASDELTQTSHDMLSLINAGKRVVFISPASASMVDKFVMDDPRMMCPEFDRVKFASNGCYYKCDWCFLKATYRANQNFINVHVEYDKIKKQLAAYIKKAGRPVMFDSGELADSLAMEHLTKAGQEFIPWFGQQENGYLYMLTKSANVDDILKLEHNKHTIITWSINADLVSRQFEIGAPTFRERLNAAKEVQKAGYPIRLRLDPIIPIPQWKHHYSGAIKKIYEELKPERITLGTLRFEEILYNMRNTIFNSPELKKLANSLQPMLPEQAIAGGKTSVGKYSFSEEQRIEMFNFAIGEIRKYAPDVTIALCKETEAVWTATGLDLEKCQCVCQYKSADMSKRMGDAVGSTIEVELVGEGDQAKDSTVYEDKKLYELKIEDLQPDPDQPRKFFDDDSLAEMKTSIEKHGVLQPVLFRKGKTGNLILVSGERRYRASKLAGKTTIPAIFTEGNAAEIALVENLLRENLNPIEEAEALERLKKEASYNNEQLSALIGKAPSTISEILSLTKLPKRIKDKCRNDPKVSRRALVEVAKGSDEIEMKKRFKKYVKENLTGDALRATTRATRELDSVLMTMINSLTSKLTESDLETIDGTKKSGVETKLRELERLIQEKLNTAG
jgi:ParB/RepB/Spo0J family partition protein